MPRCYKANSYGYLYTSFTRYLGLPGDEAGKRLYTLCTANIDTCNHHYPDRHYHNITPFAFYSLLKRRKRPYRTEVQLYKSMLALRANIALPACTEEQRDSIKWLEAQMANMNSRFRERYNMDIDDPGTCYSECLFHIAPNAQEPHDPLISKTFEKLEAILNS